MFAGHSQSLSHNTSTDISEIATRDRKYNILALGLHLFICEQEIKHLWEPSGHIDTIRRGQLHVLDQLFVQESCFYHVLAVVKCTFNFQGSYVLAQSGQLFLLNIAHLSARI